MESNCKDVPVRKAGLAAFRTTEANMVVVYHNRCALGRVIGEVKRAGG